MQLHLPVSDHCSWQADNLRQFNAGKTRRSEGLMNCLWQEQHRFHACRTQHIYLAPRAVHRYFFYVWVGLSSERHSFLFIIMPIHANHNVFDVLSQQCKIRCLLILHSIKKLNFNMYTGKYSTHSWHISSSDKYHEATLTMVTKILFKNKNKIKIRIFSRTFSLQEDIAEDNKGQCEFHQYLHHFKYKSLIYNKRQGGFIHPNVLRTRWKIRKFQRL